MIAIHSFNLQSPADRPDMRKTLGKTLGGLRPGLKSRRRRPSAARVW
jgi:hypothetical protein